MAFPENLHICHEWAIVKVRMMQALDAITNLMLNVSFFFGLRFATRM